MATKEEHYWNLIHSDDPIRPTNKAIAEALAERDAAREELKGKALEVEDVLRRLAEAHAELGMRSYAPPAAESAPVVGGVTDSTRSGVGRSSGNSRVAGARCPAGARQSVGSRVTTAAASIATLTTRVAVSAPCMRAMELCDAGGSASTRRVKFSARSSSFSRRSSSRDARSDGRSSR